MSSTNRGVGREGLDRYYTPAALAGALVGLLDVVPGSLVIEPSVGAGAFARALMHQGCSVLGIDADERAPWLLKRGGLCADVLSTDLQADWYIGNPPFRDAERHLRHALSRSRVGCAFLLRLAFLESKKRYQFWSDHSVSEVYVLSTRPSFTGNGTDSCAYAFFVWRRHREGHKAQLEVLPPGFGAGGEG